MIKVKGLATALLSPIVLITLLMAIALFFSNRNRQGAYRSFMTSALLLLAIFSQPYVTNVVLYPLEFGFLKQNNSDEKSFRKPSAIFVPACYYKTTGKISGVAKWHECSLQRMVRAVQLSNEIKVPVVVSGGYFLSDKKINFALVARDFLVSMGLNESEIIVLPQGNSTYSEVKALSKLYDNKFVITVTSATHRLRLNKIMDDANIDTEIISVDYYSSGVLKPFLSLPSAAAMEGTKKGFYEYAALVKYFIFGY